MQRSHSQPRSGCEERVRGLPGGKEGRITYVREMPGWETMGRWVQDGVGGGGKEENDKQSPDASVTRIYDIIMHCILRLTVQIPLCYFLRTTCYLEKTGLERQYGITAKCLGCGVLKT